METLAACSIVIIVACWTISRRIRQTTAPMGAVPRGHQLTVRNPAGRVACTTYQGFKSLARNSRGLSYTVVGCRNNNFSEAET